jgi:ribosome production factor 1
MNTNSIKTAITTSVVFEKKNLIFIKSLLKITPLSRYFKRKNYKIRQLITYCKIKEYRNLLVLVKKKKSIFLWQIDIKSNFVISYRLDSFTITGNLYKLDKNTNTNSELILKNFRGKKGIFLSRMIKILFFQIPNFRSRQVLSFFHENDYIFVRFHRYIFSSSGKDVRIQEIGPRITLKFLTIFELIY